MHSNNFKPHSSRDARDTRDPESPLHIHLSHHRHSYLYPLDSPTTMKTLTGKLLLLSLFIVTVVSKLALEILTKGTTDFPETSNSTHAVKLDGHAGIERHVVGRSLPM